VAVLAFALSGCEAGSKSASPEYYAIHFEVSQKADGAVSVAGETDLPDGTQIDGLVSKPGPADGAVDRAVLIGSTEEDPVSAPIKEGKFTLNLVRVLANSCGIQPPCGPFPGGRYLLLLDARTPRGPVGNGHTTFEDPRYLATTHGTARFTGIEIAKDVTLAPIHLCLDASGERHEGTCGVT